MTAFSLRRRVLVPGAALGVLAIGLSATPASATVNTDGSTTIDILSITDFHGALVQAPNIAAQVDAFRAQNPDTAFVAVGDSVGGSTFQSALQDDDPTIAALNAAGLQLSAVGNHEFDDGFADLTGDIIPSANFGYLGANVIDSATGDPALTPYEIVDMSGVSVAFVGTVTDETPSVVSPAGIEGLSFLDPVATTNQYAAALSDGNAANGEADIVVALIHEGGEEVAAGLSADVDAAFAGHSHVEASLLTPSGAPVLQASAAGGLLGHVNLTVATDGTHVINTAENLPVQEYDVADTAPDAAVFDPEVAQIVRDAFAAAEELGARPVGSVLAAFNGASNTGTPSGATPPSNRGGESALGNLLAEIAQATAINLGRDADFGIINPGGIRADLDPNADGVVTFAEAFGTSPFGNTIGTVDLTGAQVIALLEQQFVARGDRPMLALGLSDEISYLYNPAAAAGSKVTDVFFQGAPIDTAATFTVAANTFLLAGGDDFTVLTEGTNFQETGFIDVDGVTDYLQAHPDLDVSTVQQSIGLTPESDVTQAFAPGDEVAVGLSSLSFTTNEQKPDVVRISLDDAAVGTATVDNTVTAGTNETGQASAVFTIPAGTPDGVYTVRYEWDVEYADPNSTTAAQPMAGLQSTEGTTAESSEPKLDLVAAAAVPTTQWVTIQILVQSDAPVVTPTPTPTAPVDGGSGSDDDSGVAAGGGTLPETGGDIAWIVGLLALVAVLAGTGFVVARRRRA